MGIIIPLEFLLMLPLISMLSAILRFTFLAFLFSLIHFYQKEMSNFTEQLI